ALGFSPVDVRHIVLTHLDFDHAGGLEDFPHARVHVMEAERDAAERKRRGFIATRRYRPAQWDDVRDWRTYAGGGEPWFGFDSVRALDGLPPEILFVPMPGHTWGHAGVAVQTAQGWVLNAGDAYFYRRELDADRRRCTPGLRFYQTMMEVDREARLGNQQRLRDLKQAHGSEVTIFCSHDELELEALQKGARWAGSNAPVRSRTPVPA
ncbi:MAG: MBL fold metallo-hydrolase, partial [Rhizorhabdus sp.]